MESKLFRPHKLEIGEGVELRGRVWYCMVYTMKAIHDGHNLSIEIDTKTFMSLRERGALSGFAFFLFRNSFRRPSSLVRREGDIVAVA